VTISKRNLAVDETFVYYLIRKGRIVTIIDTSGAGAVFTPVVTKSVLAKVVARLDAVN